MTTDPEFDRSVKSFLEEGADRMPDRVFRSVMDIVPSAQRRRSRTWWRRWSVAPLVRVVATSALVVVVIVGGVAILSRGGEVGRVAPSPKPTAAPSSSPVPAASPIASGGPLTRDIPVGTVLGAGTYEVGEPFAFPFTITLPAETQLGEQGAGRASFNTPDGSVEIFVPEGVFTDPCHPTASPTPVKTAGELVDALSSMAGFTPSSPTSTTVSGYPAQRFVLTNTIDTATAGCTRDLMLPMFTFLGNAEGAATNGGMRQVLWVVDVHGQLLLVVGDGWGDAARGALEALVGTIALR